MLRIFLVACCVLCSACGGSDDKAAPAQQKAAPTAAASSAAVQVGDAQLLDDVWTGVDALANMYIWQILLSF